MGYDRYSLFYSLPHYVWIIIGLLLFVYAIMLFLLPVFVFMTQHYVYKILKELEKLNKQLIPLNRQSTLKFDYPICDQCKDPVHPQNLKIHDNKRLCPLCFADASKYPPAIYQDYL